DATAAGGINQSLPGSEVSMDLLAAARDGIRTVEAPDAVREKAAQYLAAWLGEPEYAPYRPQVEWMIRSAKWSLVLDSFYQVRPFGPGARRGAVGTGPNRMTLWTLGASVQGHCEYLKQRFPGVDPLHVVLAFDVRVFEDKRGVYAKDLPNPVLHLTSREFCQ